MSARARTGLDGCTAADVVERGLAAAASAADHVSSSVIVEDTHTVNLRWACSTVTTNGACRWRAVSVVVAVSTPAGVAAASVTRTSDGVDVADQVADALAQARRAPAAEDARDLVEGQVDDAFAAAAEPTGPAALTRTVEQLGAGLDVFRSQDDELFGFAEQNLTTTWLGTSTGTRRRHVQPGATVELTGKSHGRSRSTYANASASELDAIDVTGLCADLRTRLGWQARTVDVAPGRHDTILPPTSLADLMISLYWAADARSAIEGRSAFSLAGTREGQAAGTRVGARLGELALDLASDPALPGRRAMPFVAAAVSSPTASVFDNGLELGPTDWVKDGVLQHLPGSRHAAALASVPATPAIDNLVLTVDGARGGLDELVAGTARGLLLTSQWYIREVDPMTMLLTGLTRDGVYVVRDGEVVGATTNFRFNESPVDLLGRIEAAGASVPTLSREWSDHFTRTVMPPVRVSGFNMSTPAQGT